MTLHSPLAATSGTGADGACRDASPDAVAGECRVRVAARLPHKLAAALMAELERDVSLARPAPV